MDPNTPVLVGVGLVMQREAQLQNAREPLALMIESAIAAGKDCGQPDLLQQVARISVPVGRWRYRNPGRLIGNSIGAPHASSISALPGVSQQTLLSDTCSAINQGEISAALVVGGEAGYRLQQAKIAGTTVKDTPSEDLADLVMKPQQEMLPDYEQQSGLGQMPVGYYAILDSALRHAQGFTLDEYRDRIAARYSRFSTIAKENPHAWHRESFQASQIRNASKSNPMLAFPYTKLHNAQWNVDQSSALLFCSAGLAESLNIPRERWVFPQVFTEANHMLNITARGELHRCVGAELAGRAAFDAAGCQAESLDYYELYSCFPVAVESYAQALNIPSTDDWSFTGGMPFAGGPFNNFVLHTVAQLAQRLRRNAHSRGMVTTVSGILTKQGFAIWGGEPNPNAYQFVDVTSAVAAATDERDVVADYCGNATIAGYTVLHNRAGAHRAVVIADLPDSRRTIAYCEDSSTMLSMESTDYCGRTVSIEDGQFSAVQTC
ncbi:MAG: hypothetical protein ACU84Q_07540 [Gammaproteobacteria bacterium]